jgi:PDDEXK-like domain of unknown function (DUF3799)
MARKATVAPGEPGAADHAAASAGLRRFKSGCYTISAEDYHADHPCPKPSLSASLADTLYRKSPGHAWLEHPRLNPNFKRSVDPKFDLGTVAHAAMLQGAAPFKTVQADDWKTGPARQERDEIRAFGLIPILEKDWERIRTMINAARWQLRQIPGATTFAAGHGEAEQTLLWQDGPIYCRARLDWIDKANRTIWDYKTTDGSAEPTHWGARQMYDIGADIQAEFYRRGAAMVFGKNFQFRFVVQETYEPFALSIVALDPEAEQIARDKVEDAIHTWGVCQRRQHWPLYPGRISYASPPVWMTKEVETGKIQREVDRSAKVDAFRFSLAMYRPTQS